MTGASLAQLPLGKEVDPPLRLLGLDAFWQLQGVSSDCSCACLGGAKLSVWLYLVLCGPVVKLRSFQALCSIDTVRGEQTLGMIGNIAECEPTPECWERNQHRV